MVSILVDKLSAKPHLRAQSSHHQATHSHVTERLCTLGQSLVFPRLILLFWPTMQNFVLQDPSEQTGNPSTSRFLNASGLMYGSVGTVIGRP